MAGGLTVRRLIVREIQASKVNSSLGLATVALAVAVLVAMVSTSRASVDATRVMMKQMGFNLLITPKGVDPARYQALDFQEADMPEEYVQRLAESTVLAQHFVGKYQKTVPIEGCLAVLTGVLAEVPRHDLYRKPMPTAYTVPEGHVFVGAALAGILGIEPGADLTILGKGFVVDRVLPEVGVSPEDIRVFAHLHDVQEILGKPGRINAIDALSCFCPVEVDDLLTALEESVRRVLPDVEARPYKSILLARQEQRGLMQRLQAIVVALIVAGSATAIWGLTYQNISNRRREIGVFRALGIPDRLIVWLFIGKVLAYGLPGTLAGCGVGYLAARWIPVAERVTTPPMDVMGILFLATPLAAVLFSLPPIVGALCREPVDVLGEGAG